MPTYVYDHIHLRTRDPKGMAEYFHRMFDAKVIESIQSDGQPRVDLDIDANGASNYCSGARTDRRDS